MDVSLFDYDLPPARIAQEPASIRSGSRLLRLDRVTGKIKHDNFNRIYKFFREGDLVVFNDIRVFPARLMAKRSTGGRVEVFLLQYPGNGPTPCLISPSRRIKNGEIIYLANGTEVCVQREGESFYISTDKADLALAVETLGQIPLPPYIKRDGGLTTVADRTRYQTIFANHTGAVAAPTAGLHFDEEILEQLRCMNINVAFITMYVGAGTFQPVRVNDITGHNMEEEKYVITPETAAAVNETRNRNGRIVAIGTTVVRTLESVFTGGEITPGSSSTDLFIYPGYEFRVVDALVTNFHLPRSTLLMLVCAFAGTDSVLAAYREAVSQKYRFYSYGDAMFIE